MANTAVQLAANTEVNEVSEGVSHCTTGSFTLAPEPRSLPLPPQTGIYCSGRCPLPHLQGQCAMKSLSGEEVIPLAEWLSDA